MTHEGALLLLAHILSGWQKAQQLTFACYVLSNGMRCGRQPCSNAICMFQPYSWQGLMLCLPVANVYLVQQQVMALLAHRRPEAAQPHGEGDQQLHDAVREVRGHAGGLWPGMPHAGGQQCATSLFTCLSVGLRLGLRAAGPLAAPAEWWHAAPAACVWLAPQALRQP